MKYFIESDQAAVSFITSAPAFPSFLRPTQRSVSAERHRFHLRHLPTTLIRSHPTCKSSPDDEVDALINISPLSARDLKSRTHPLWKKYPQSIPPSSNAPSIPEALHWINLTNGVELLPSFSSFISAPPSNVRFTRLQSSHCESAAYEKLLWSLDSDMLLSLSVGRPCYVYDLASRNKLRGVSRALFLGLQFVRWSLAYLWFAADQPHLVPERVLVRGKNTVPFWRDDVMRFRTSKEIKKHIRYYTAYASEMGTSDVRLFGVYGGSTTLDGCMGLHVKFVRQWIEHQQGVVEDGNGYSGDDKGECPTDHEMWMQRVGLVVYDPEATCDKLRDIQKQIISDENIGEDDDVFR